MSELKHHRGLQEEQAKQLRKNMRMGGPTEAFQKEAQKHGVNLKPTNIGKTRRDGFVFNDGRGLVVCVKCGEKKLNGYLEEGLCEECYET